MTAAPASAPGPLLRFSVGRVLAPRRGVPHDHEPVEMTLVDLAERLATPIVGQKGSAGFYLVARFAPGKRSKMDIVDAPALAAVDLDFGKWDAERIREVIPELIAWVAHTTASHRVDSPKWRVVFPLAVRLDVADWERVARGVSRWFDFEEGMTGFDRCGEKIAQPMYFPTVAHEGCAFSFDGETDCPLLGEGIAARLIADEKVREGAAAEEARKEGEAREKARRERADRCGSAIGDGNVIAQWNAAHPIDTTLKRYGYKPPSHARGRWLSPRSTKGVAAVHVWIDEGRFYSHHGSDQGTEYEHGDAFDLFRLYEHGGDITKALRAAAVDLGLDCATRPAGVSAPPTPPRSDATIARPFIPAPHLDSIEGLSAPYWIKGIIDACATGYLFGKFSVGKTFMALLMAACVADGRPFFGRRVRQGLVFYSFGEGALGMHRRVRALRLEGQLSTDNLFLRDRAADLRDHSNVAEMIDGIRESASMSALQVGLIILDTARRHMGAGEENPGPDTAALFDAACEIREAFDGSSAVIIAHEGHEKDRLRGHSNQGSDADFLIRLARDKDSPAGRLSIEKTKDDAAGEPLTYRLRVVDLDVQDIDGDPLTSCVTESIEVDEVHAAKRLTKNETIVRDALRANLSVADGTSFEAPGFVARGTLLDWVERNARVTRKQRRGIVHKGLKALKSRGFVEFDDQKVFLLRVLP